jgi:hypothetical protein
MRLVLFIATLAVSACEGSLLGGIFGTGRPDDPRPIDPTKEPLESPGPSSRLPRLNNTEYENTVTDLLHLPARPNLASTFVTDSTSSTFDTNGALLNVDATSWSDYQRAAEQLASTATSDLPTLARTFGGTVPVSVPEQVTELARRAWRRPPTAAEVTELVTLFGRAATLTPNVAPALGGNRLVLEALLQSPHFLYRPELSTEVKDGVVPLDPYELAARLSYALWRTMPDEALFAAAASGELSTRTGYVTQARRLLNDPRARTTVASFHDQLLHVQKVFDVTRNTTLFPEFSTALRASMAEEQRAFVRHVVLDQREGLTTLLTAPYTFLDANTARVYGSPGVTSLSKVSLTGDRRGGLLTQLAFLATNATSTTSDPIHRGTFVNHQLLCSGLPPPPKMVPALPAEDPTAVRTLRQRIDAFTGRGTCGEGCHSTFINPVGFAYENYDALGRWRDTEKSLPIDATGEFMFDEKLEPFSGSAEFGKKLAESKAAHACYMEHWLEYLYGRRLAESERPLVTRLAKQSRERDAAVMGLWEELVASDAFRARNPEGATP